MKKKKSHSQLSQFDLFYEELPLTKGRFTKLVRKSKKTA